MNFADRIRHKTALLWYRWGVYCFERSSRLAFELEQKKDQSKDAYFEGPDEGLDALRRLVGAPEKYEEQGEPYPNVALDKQVMEAPLPPHAEPSELDIFSSREKRLGGGVRCR